MRTIRFDLDSISARSKPKGYTVNANDDDDTNDHDDHDGHVDHGRETDDTMLMMVMDMVMTTGTMMIATVDYDNNNADHLRVLLRRYDQSSCRFLHSSSAVSKPMSHVLRPLIPDRSPINPSTKRPTRPTFPITPEHHNARPGGMREAIK